MPFEEAVADFLKVKSPPKPQRQTKSKKPKK
jgi:hypothetical protein